MATAPYLDGRLEQQPNDAEFTIGTEGADAITVNIQLRQGERDITAQSVVIVYLSSDAVGAVPVAAQTSLAQGTDGTELAALVAETVNLVLSEADGDIDIVVTDTGTAARYLNVVMPSGKVCTSDDLGFA